MCTSKNIVTKYFVLLLLTTLPLFDTYSDRRSFEIHTVTVPDHCDQNFSFIDDMNNRGEVVGVCGSESSFSTGYETIFSWSLNEGVRSYTGYELDEQEILINKILKIQDNGTINAIVRAPDLSYFSRVRYLLTIKDDQLYVDDLSTAVPPLEFALRYPDEPMQFSLIGPQGGIIGQAMTASARGYHFFHYIDGQLSHLRTFNGSRKNLTEAFLHPKEKSLLFRVRDPRHTFPPDPYPAGQLCDEKKCTPLDVVYHRGIPHDMNDRNYLVGRLWRPVIHGIHRDHAAMWYRQGNRYRYKLLPLNQRNTAPQNFNTLSDAYSINNKDVIAGVIGGRKVVLWTRTGPRKNPGWRLRNITKPIMKFLGVAKKNIYFSKVEINDCGDLFVYYMQSHPNISRYYQTSKSIFLKSKNPSCPA